MVVGLILLHPVIDALIFKLLKIYIINKEDKKM